MQFKDDSLLFKGAYAKVNMFGTILPLEYTGAKDEYLACRSTAWLGSALNCSPVLDISGADAAKFLNKYCVNRDFSLMEPGTSKHALMCNKDGNMIADGVVMYRGEGVYRTYWLAPVILFYVMKSGMDVRGDWKQGMLFTSSI